MAGVMVTGGAGFIGSYLVRALARRGVDTFVLDALRDYAHPLPADGEDGRARELRGAMTTHAPLLRSDMLDTAQLTAWLAEHEPEVVVHLAANPIVGAATRDRRGCDADIVQNTQSLVRAIEATGSTTRLVYVSSSMVYGHFTSDRLSESSPTRPVNAYGQMKLAAEGIVRDLAARTGAAVTVVRLMAVYGPGDYYERVVGSFCSAALAGRPLMVTATADTMIDFSFVEDVAEGLALAALEPAAAGETFNLSYGQARGLHEVVAALTEHFPDLRSQLAPALAAHRPSRGSLDITKARHLLGYRPQIGLEHGIERYLDFLETAGGPSAPAALPAALTRPAPGLPPARRAGGLTGAAG